MRLKTGASGFMLKAMNEFDYDVIVVGGGSGGYAAARTAANADLRTAVVEGGKEVGGLCILRGCMPTKALLYAAEVKHLAEHPAAWGIQSGKVSFDFAKVMARKDALIKEFADYRAQQLSENTFTFIRAQASFVDAHTITLSTGEKLRARNFVISTGSVVAPSPLPFLSKLDYLTSDEALMLKKLPKSLIILGGGSVAVEFAQFFARFDVKVTLIQRSPHVLHEFDTDTSEVLEKVFKREGMTVYTNTTLTDAWQTNGLKGVSFLHEAKEVRVEAEEVLYALGRVPNTKSLNLDKAGVEVEDRRIIANEEMQTSAKHIYAAGDCTGPYEIVHIAVMQGEAAGHNIAFPDKPRRMDYRLVNSVVFTEPQVAMVALTEKEALRQNIPYRAASYPFADHGKSMIMEAKDGFVKLLANPETGEIIGGCCVGPVGGELIHEIIAAMYKRMTVKELAAMPHYHPTLAEIWTYPAEELALEIQPSPVELTDRQKALS
ncbi:dihydrolipoyl dehydrogenase family protein [Pedosphaera parvula]|uniref:Pyridine nucleotide-disulphide oxidoreductase dimerisation region n=1 Tax=Pedosphaera parvula (strain Ellin514) TaxID=320771 RepID=B9XE79_PEDPL|nr:NAD(P)/FAD-dependent oxidoreductase [Pedosphaera parvula]EEF61970.1 pyridine nucleotide-disulphide oxidoreductase dimerisation region [Pedosphaera parvula Ellin514]